MREIITTGKTVEEATQRALEELGVSMEEVSVEVIDMPQRKLFRTIPAKVRVTADDEPPQALVDYISHGAGRPVTAQLVAARGDLRFFAFR